MREPDLTTAPLIDSWRFIPVTEDGRGRLVGRISDHPTVPSAWGATSEVLVLDREAGRARTRSRWYRLGAEAAPGTIAYDGRAIILELLVNSADWDGDFDGARRRAMELF